MPRRGGRLPADARRGCRGARGEECAVDTRSSRPWTEPGPDPELLQQAQRGELTALLRLYNTQRLSLWRVCLVITRHRGEAGLRVQEMIDQVSRTGGSHSA